MGEPAIPTAQERAETWALAAKIVEAVRNDEALPLEMYLHDDSENERSIEDLAVMLAHEIELLRDDLAAERKRSESFARQLFASQPD